MKKVDDEVKGQVYDALCDSYAFGEDILLADIPFVLGQAGIRKEDYGFDKLSQFLEEFSLDRGGFLELQSVRRGNGSAAVARLHEFRASGTRRAGLVGGGRPSSGGHEHLSFPIRVRGEEEGPTSGADQPRVFADNRPGRSPSFTNDTTFGHAMPSSFCDEVNVPRGRQEVLRKQLGEDADIFGFLNSGWNAASEEGRIKSRRSKKYGDGWTFSTRTSDGRRIDITINRSESEGASKEWFVSYVTDSPEITSDLKRFTDFNALEVRFDDLARMAVDEDWGDGYGVLEHYLTVTFSRLRAEGKLRTDERGGGFAAFNTGLLSKYYDDIFAVFQGRDSSSGKWRLSGFYTVSDSGAVSRELSSRFNPLPEPATYFTRKEDLILDTYASITPVYEHILLDNIDRLPKGYLRRRLSGDQPVARQLDRAESSRESERSDAYRAIADYIRSVPFVYRSMRDDLDSAIRTAQRRARWNYKTAVPIYYPKYDGMNLLLPLVFGDATGADVALVVTRLDSGSYRGSTILTTEQAYLDARVVCPPDSSWLRVQG